MKFHSFLLYKNTLFGLHRSFFYTKDSYRERKIQKELRKSERDREREREREREIKKERDGEELSDIQK